MSFCVWVNMLAQVADSTYDFSTFIYPDIDYRGMSFYSGLSGHGSKTGSNLFLPEGSAADFALREQVSYFSIVNTPEKQYYHTVTGRVLLDWDNVDQIDLRRNIRVSPLLSGEQQTRWYRGKRFWEITTDYLASFNSESSRLNTAKELDIDVRIDIIPFIMRGIGRIEPVSDVNLAWFLVNDLAEEGLLAGSLTSDELNLLGHRMARARHRRIFDGRHKRIQELKSIDSLIVQNAWCQTNGIDYFAILNDNWAFANRPFRFAGKRFSYGVMPRLKYLRDVRDQNFPGFPGRSVQRSVTIGGYLLMQYMSEKPLTMIWQRSYGGSLSVGYEQEGVRAFSGNTFDRESRSANLAVYYGIGYFPNSRTQWTNGLTARLRVQDRDAVFRSAETLDLTSSLYYYITPRLQIQGSFALSIDLSDNTTSSLFSASTLAFNYDVISNPYPLYSLNTFGFFNGDRVVAGLSLELSYAIF